MLTTESPHTAAAAGWFHPEARRGDFITDTSLMLQEHNLTRVLTKLLIENCHHSLREGLPKPEKAQRPEHTAGQNNFLLRTLESEEESIEAQLL